MNIIQKQQETELKKFEICFEILRNARSELYLGMRFMDVALSSVQFLLQSYFISVKLVMMPCLSFLILVESSCSLFS